MNFQKLLGASALALAFTLAACGDDKKDEATGVVEQTADDIEEGTDAVVKKVEDAFSQVDDTTGSGEVKMPASEEEHHDMVKEHAEEFAKDHAHYEDHPDAPAAPTSDAPAAPSGADAAEKK
jgi:hypothetical protein